MDDYRKADLSESDRAICEHAERVAREPASTTEGDVARLREVGLDDRAILDVNLVASIFAFFTRMADGLGVELEAAMEDPPENYR